ncbi:NAD-dependent epimerase/dehydratase family protein [Fibrobacterota bacterium]
MKQFNENDRLLIIGGTGFIGKNLIKRCLSGTRNIVSIGFNENDTFSGELNDVPVVEVDICDKQAVENFFYGREFDYVINLAGYIDHTPFFNGGRALITSHFSGLMNVFGALNREMLKSFVQIGSSDEYGGQPAPQHEGLRENPISPYSFAKTAATQLIQMLHHTEGFPGTVLRFFLVYGPGQDDRRFLPQIIKACLRNETFKTSAGEQLRDFCHIDDVTDAIISAALTEGARGRVLNIGSGRPVSVSEVINMVKDITGGGSPDWGRISYRPGENMALYPDVESARDILGWQASVSIEAGLKETIDWYKTRI